MTVGTPVIPTKAGPSAGRTPIQSGGDHAHHYPIMAITVQQRVEISPLRKA